MTPVLTQITTSRSAYVAALDCLRRRWHGYEADNGTPTRGWERRKLAIPLATGTHTHKGVEALWGGSTPAEAAAWARKSYLTEVAERGLEAEVTDADTSRTAAEQAALIEAFTYAWARVRLPELSKEYDLVGAEREMTVSLSDDVMLQARADAILRRRSDQRIFIYNPKTVSDAGERWYRGWETDIQIMTEMLAAEATLGEPVHGVLIEGFIKGKRHKEEDTEGNVIGYRQGSPLIYGYRTEANPPFQRELYDWEYTRKKGWFRFPVWEHSFEGATTTPIEWWVNWLPEQVVRDQLAIVPPIWRDQAVTESAVRQIVAMERRIRQAREAISNAPLTDVPALLDEHFPMNSHSCIWPSVCPMYAACWEAGVADDMAGSGLYQPRVSHHAPQEEV